MKASLILVTWAETDFRMKLLKETLESLFEETEYPFELILVDNGPKQQTDFLCKHWGSGIDVHIINDVNVGIANAFNQGIKEITGEYVSFLANDIRFESGWLGDCVKALEKYPDQKLIASSHFSCHQKGAAKRHFLGVLDEYTLWNRTSPGGWVLRKETLDDIGLWPVHEKPGSKYCDRITRKGYKWVLLPKPKLFHMAEKKASYDYRHRLIDGKWVQNGA